MNTKTIVRNHWSYTLTNHIPSSHHASYQAVAVTGTELRLVELILSKIKGYRMIEPLDEPRRGEPGRIASEVYFNGFQGQTRFRDERAENFRHRLGFLGGIL